MERWIARLAIAVAALLVASIVLLAGIGFLCFALYLTLLEKTSPPIAAAATGLAALILAGFTIFAARLISAGMTASRRAERRSKDGVSADEASKLATDLGNLLGKELGSLVHTNPRVTLVVSLLSGFAIGAFPGLRRALRDLLLKS